jgi:hypothetical protein
MRNAVQNVARIHDETDESLKPEPETRRSNGGSLFKRSKYTLKGLLVSTSFSRRNSATRDSWRLFFTLGSYSYRKTTSSVPPRGGSVSQLLNHHLVPPHSYFVVKNFMAGGMHWRKNVAYLPKC